MRDTVDEPTPELSEEDRRSAQAIFEGFAIDAEGKPRSGCVHCSGIHPIVRGLPASRQPCRRVKEITWSGDVIASVVYWRDGQWDEAGIVFPDDVYEDDGRPEDEVAR